MVTRMFLVWPVAGYCGKYVTLYIYYQSFHNRSFLENKAFPRWPHAYRAKASSLVICNCNNGENWLKFPLCQNFTINKMGNFNPGLSHLADRVYCVICPHNVLTHSVSQPIFPDVSYIFFQYMYSGSSVSVTLTWLLWSIVQPPGIGPRLLGT